MKISLEWLGDYVTWIEHDPLKIADRLTLRTAEVEEVEVRGKLLKHCCVGEILSVEKHPSADRLSVCTVQTDKGKKTVVCGGTNVRADMLVAFAHVGATVRWHGEGLQTLERVKIRGVESEGMICAAEELELEAMFPPRKEDGERAVVDLSRIKNQESRIKTGDALREALMLDDVILHLNNTALTMRPDLFSHIGVARECVAMGLAKWKKEPAFHIPKFPKVKGLTMHVECAALVPRYLGCTINIDNIGETPDWMIRRLVAVGVRPINPPVDITNYVASEIGVPLHSFDIDDLHGDIHLRLSKKDESITTLDSVERSLPDGALVLSDDKGVFDLLGIMGGLRSSTKASTRRIYLHAAALDPATIRRAVIATGHRTDAATVYEKGVAPITTEQGFFRALNLMLELTAGALIASSLENKGTNGKASAIALSLGRVHQLLGTAIPEKTIVKILTDLGCILKTSPRKTSNQKPETRNLSVTPPLHRLRDITGDHDLIEEIGRVYGYENIQDSMPVAPIQIPKRDAQLHKIRDQLKASHFFEIVPLSFVSPQLLRRCNMPTENAIAIENPLGEETSLLQTSTLPHLLTHAQQNFLGAQSPLKTFHCAHVFEKGKPEHLELGLLVTAKAATDLLHDPFLIAKENLLNACNDAGYELSIQQPPLAPRSPPEADEVGFAHPGRCAALLHHDKECGWIFEVHPAIRAAFDLPHRCSAIILDLTSLFKNAPVQKHAAALPAFPAVTYDETIARSHAQPIEKLLRTSRSTSPLLEDVHIHDLFQKKEQEYNLTLRFTYRSSDRTLTEEEAKEAHGKVTGMIS